MFGSLKSSLKGRLKGVVEDIKGRRVEAAEAYVAPARAPPPPPRTVAPTRTSVVEPLAEPYATSAAESTATTVREPLPLPEPVEAQVEAAPEIAPPAPAPEIAPPAPAPPMSVAAMAAAAAHGRTSGLALYADMGSTGLDAYMARAKANGRDIGAIRGGTGLNVAEDGTAYSGPVDNESSRAKAAGKVLTVDQFECISCGTCVEQTDKVYVLPPDGKASPVAQDGPMDLIQDAIDACPVTCIAWVSPEEAEERGLATGIVDE